MKYDKYRMYRQPTYGSSSGAGKIDGRYLGDWAKTRMTFKGRNEKEALRKAEKFWQDGEFGMGSIMVKKEDGINV